MQSVDTWEPSGVSSQRGRHWQEEGLEQIDLWTPPSATSVPLGRQSVIQYIHMYTHKMGYIHTKPNYTASHKYAHSDTKLSCEVLIKKSQTFVGTGHPFEVISKCRLASNQVREYPHLRRGHVDVNRFRDGRITPNMQSDLSPQYFIVLSRFCLKGNAKSLSGSFFDSLPSNSHSIFFDFNIFPGCVFVGGWA